MKKPTILKKVATALAMTAICCSTLVPTMAKAEVQPRACTGHNYVRVYEKKEQINHYSHWYEVEVEKSDGTKDTEDRLCSVVVYRVSYDKMCSQCSQLLTGFSETVYDHSAPCNSN